MKTEPETAFSQPLHSLAFWLKLHQYCQWTFIFPSPSFLGETRQPLEQGTCPSLPLSLPEYEVLYPGALELDLPALHEHAGDVRAVLEVRALPALAAPALRQRVAEDESQQPVREPVQQPHALEPHVVQHHAAAAAAASRG